MGSIIRTQRSVNCPNILSTWISRPLLTAPLHRSQGTPSHVHVWIHHFHVRRRHRQRPPNRPPLPLFRRCLWLLSPRRCGRRLLRHVRQPLARSCNYRLLHDGLFGPLTRPFYWWLHRHKPAHGLAMDAVYRGDHGCSGIHPGFTFRARVLPTNCARPEGCRAPSTNQKLGDPCQARGNRGRLPRIGHEELHPPASTPGW